MPDNVVCPKCGSKDLILHAHVFTNMHGHQIDLTVYEKPDALVFKGVHTGRLHARICGCCGFVELFVANPAELLEAYRRAQERGPAV